MLKRDPLIGQPLPQQAMLDRLTLYRQQTLSLTLPPEVDNTAWNPMFFQIV